MPGSEESGLESGRRLPRGHPGAGGAKCPEPSSASGRGAAGAQGAEAPPGDAEGFVPVLVSFVAGDPDPRGSCSPFPAHLQEPQERQWERFIQLSAEESSSLFSRCTEELHCQTLQARTIAALCSRWTRCF